MRQKKKRYGNFVLVIIVLLNFIFLFSCLGMIVAQKDKIKTAAELQASENTRVEDFITRLNFYDQEKKELLVRTNVLKEIGFARINWSAVLQDIGMRVPSNIELTSIQGDSSIFDPQNRIKLADEKFVSPEAIIITGNAPTYLDVSNFLIRLKLVSVIETGSYAASNSIVQDQKVVTFTIKLWWRNVAVIPELAKLQKDVQEKEKAQELQHGEETEEGQIQEELQQEAPGG